MDEGHENDPLHGVTLEAMLLSLVEKYGWEGLAERIPVKCFSLDPSVKSSLTFLRRTPWARAKVEKLYLGKLKARRPAKRPGAPRGPAAKTGPSPTEKTGSGPTAKAAPRGSGGAARPDAAKPKPKTSEGSRRYPGIWVDEE